MGTFIDLCFLRRVYTKKMEKQLLFLTGLYSYFLCLSGNKKISRKIESATLLKGLPGCTYTVKLIFLSEITITWIHSVAVRRTIQRLHETFYIEREKYVKCPLINEPKEQTRVDSLRKHPCSSIRDYLYLNDT